VVGSGLCIIVPNFVVISHPIIKIVQIFTLHFKKLEILMANEVERVKMHHRAKFCDDWSKHYGDMVIYQFFQYGSPAGPGMLCVCLDHSRKVFDGLYFCAKFGWNSCSSFNSMRFWILRVWLENAYLCPQNGF